MVESEREEELKDMYPLAAADGTETKASERGPIRGELVGVTRGTTVRWMRRKRRLREGGRIVIMTVRGGRGGGGGGGGREEEEGGEEGEEGEEEIIYVVH